MDETYNYENVFFRMVTLALAKTLNKHITWINYFSSGKKCIKVPFFNKMLGDERFLFDAFLDDMADRRVELNTDTIPRGVISLTSYGPVSDEFANPNIYIPKRVKIHERLREFITKVKAVPITLNYDIVIHLDNERDIMVCSEKILIFLYNYYFFRMDYFGLKLDVVLQLPDDKTIELPDKIDLNSDNPRSIKFPLTVRTYYPIWKVDTDKYECEDEAYENIKRVYWDVYIHDFKDLDEVELPDLINTDLKTLENLSESGLPDFEFKNPDYNLTSSSGYTFNSGFTYEF